MRQTSVIDFGHLWEDEIAIVLMKSVCQDKREDASVEKVVWVAIASTVGVSDSKRCIIMSYYLGNYEGIYAWKQAFGENNQILYWLQDYMKRWCSGTIACKGSGDMELAEDPNGNNSLIDPVVLAWRPRRHIQCIEMGAE